MYFEVFYWRVDEVTSSNGTLFSFLSNNKKKEWKCHIVGVKHSSLPHYGNSEGHSSSWIYRYWHKLLVVQLPLFRVNYVCSGSKEGAKILTGLPREVRRLFTEVDTLLRRFLVLPVSSSEAGMSFSVLRSLKIWVRVRFAISTKKSGHLRQKGCQLFCQYISASRTSASLSFFLVKKRNE